ncbi:ABC transporter ATP-binding protein [Mesoplasma syrphidae]|uniref:ABC transporter ATP-binding protein n=1 Tax=Mesoplasma syrphidae TaxID=225999 RepID=A0A2K9BYN8_9MOLU|nr:ABC transporter ATP-binding protein [Mesoplasma syrphidae]AUF83488.1 ABC transporter ATP-binding protein [Mesoplasma syrphidae]
MKHKTPIIKINNLSKIYPNGYGIFNIDLCVNQGEVFGYLGPNGAGKSTTIRTIMGYIKPDQGSCEVFDYSSWKDAATIQSQVGYLPGEIAFPEFMTGTEFIKLVYNLRNQTNWNEVEELIKYWEFDPNKKIKKMSKGMKQKVGLIIAFMHHPQLIILDEPTSGLDPLMQQKFINLVNQRKSQKTTFLMSSHIFEEIEKTCDNVAIIKSGKIVSSFDLEKLRQENERYYTVVFKSNDVLKKYKVLKQELNSVTYSVLPGQVPEFVKDLNNYEIEMISENPFSLEKYFMNFYKEEGEQHA